MPKKIISYVFASLVLIFSVWSWFLIDRAIRVAESSDFIYPTLLFSLYAISLSLFIVFTEEWGFSSVIIFLSLLSSLFFSQNIFHLAPVLVAFILLLTGRMFIRKDIENSIKISLSKSLGVGMYELILAIAMAISAQYFFSVSSLPTEKLVPKFETNKITSEVVSFVLSKINPQFGAIEDENLTVDQFLGDFYVRLLKKQEAEMKKKFDEKKKEFEIVGKDNQFQLESMFEELPDGTREEIMGTWKDELSDLAGYKIGGSEKVAEVMIAMINNKTAEFFGSVGKNGSGVNKIALIFSIGLFLAIVPFGSLLSRAWVFLSWMMFWILRRFGSVKIEKKSVEAETIV